MHIRPMNDSLGMDGTTENGFRTLKKRLKIMPGKELLKLNRNKPGVKLQ